MSKFNFKLENGIIANFDQSQNVEDEALLDESLEVENSLLRVQLINLDSLNDKLSKRVEYLESMSDKIFSKYREKIEESLKVKRENKIFKNIISRIKVKPDIENGFDRFKQEYDIIYTKGKNE